MAQTKAKSRKAPKKAKPFCVKFPLFKAKSSEKFHLNNEIIHLIQEIDDIESYERSGGNPPPNWREEIMAKIENEREKMKKESARRSTVARSATATNGGCFDTLRMTDCLRPPIPQSCKSC